MKQADELDVARLRESLRRSPVGHTIDAHKSVESTMPFAHKLGADPTIPSGAIVIAEEQRAGKGRRGRTWTAPYAQAILTSVVIRPPLGISAQQVPMAAGLAVVDTLRRVGSTISAAVNLKWPNDVMLGQGRQARKVAGILVETAYDGSRPEYFVLGIGINVNQAARDLPADVGRMARPTSLRSYLGSEVDRTALLIELCSQLASRFGPMEPPERLLDEWRSSLSTLGNRVAVYEQPDASTADVVGVAVDVASTGDLLVEDDEGYVHEVTAADVSIRYADE